MRAKVHIDIQLLDEKGNVICDDHMDRIDETRERPGMFGNKVIHELVFAWNYITDIEFMRIYPKEGDKNVRERSVEQ